MELAVEKPFLANCPTLGLNGLFFNGLIREMHIILALTFCRATERTTATLHKATTKRSKKND
jgi:hypothetical protein